MLKEPPSFIISMNHDQLDLYSNLIYMFKKYPFGLCQAIQYLSLRQLQQVKALPTKQIFYNNRIFQIHSIYCMLYYNWIRTRLLIISACNYCKCTWTTITIILEPQTYLSIYLQCDGVTVIDLLSIFSLTFFFCNWFAFDI